MDLTATFGLILRLRCLGQLSLLFVVIENDGGVLP
jgi:hypothetical protein